MANVRHHRHQRGAAFVEAAIILPVFLLVTFVTIFLCLMAYRLSSIQMAANDIALSISNSFSGGGPFPCSSGTYPTNGNIVLAEHTANCLVTWRTGIATRYLIPSTAPMQIFVVGYAHQQSHDGGATISNATTLRAGDSFVLVVKYPKSNILGGKVPLFGFLQGDLVASAAGFIERPQRT